MTIFSHPDTFFYQLGIFLLTFLALRAWVFQPYLQLYRQRQELTEAREAKARAIAEQTATVRAEVEQKIGESSRQGQAIREQLRLEGEAEERRLLAEARAAGAEYYEQARQALQREAARARQELAAFADEHQNLLQEKLAGKTQAKR